MLDVDDATPFLLDRSLIDVSAIIDGDLTIRSAARRNRNIRVEGPGGSGYLIKQPDDPLWGGGETLRREGAFRRFCDEEPAAAPLDRYLPRLTLWDEEGAVLVFELIPGAVTLGMYQASPGGRESPIEVGRALGVAVGTFHRVFGPDGLARDNRLDWLPRQEPWILSIHKPGPDLLSVISPANYRMLQILQEQQDLCDRLERLRREWWPDVVIHGDVKADNILIRPSPVEIWLVDWEMVRVGDPAWDLAGVLHGYLLSWLSSMPLSVDLPAGEMIERATRPIGSMHGAIRATWAGYRSAAGLDPARANDLLLRAVSFSAARLIQWAYEALEGADRLAAWSVMTMQVASNLLADPALGQVHLYGIPRDSIGQ